MQRLFPLPGGSTTVDVAYSGPLGVRSDRPWIGLSMVQSIDGSSVIAGRSAALSNETDQAVYRRLRDLADVVIVGASTARLEAYGPPTRPDQRIGVVTRTGSVDTSSALFESGAGFVITTSAARFEERGITVVRSGATDVDLGIAIDVIDHMYGRPEFVLVEGGPALNGSFVDEDLFDEINSTTCSAIVGGDGPRIVDGAPQRLHRFDLVHFALDTDSFAFMRWRRRRAVEGDEHGSAPR